MIEKEKNRKERKKKPVKGTSKERSVRKQKKIEG